MLTLLPYNTDQCILNELFLFEYELISFFFYNIVCLDLHQSVSNKNQYILVSDSIGCINIDL